MNDGSVDWCSSNRGTSEQLQLLGFAVGGFHVLARVFFRVERQRKRRPEVFRWGVFGVFGIGGLFWFHVAVFIVGFVAHAIWVFGLGSFAAVQVRFVVGFANCGNLHVLDEADNVRQSLRTLQKALQSLSPSAVLWTKVEG